MKARILTEIERIAGDRLTPEMRNEIAESAVKIIDDLNRAKALDAMETLKDTIVQASNGSNDKEPKAK